MSLSVDVRKRLGSFSLDVSFEVADSREICALLGPSGCGKSLTLKCVTGVLTPDEGRIVLNDRVLFDSAAGVNLPPQRRRVGYLFQQYALFPTMTVEQNIGAGAVGVSREERARRVAEQVRAFHLEGLERLRPAQLSGGQQQRVGLARALAAEPRLMLLDEPFGAIDAITRNELQDELLRIHRGSGKTFVFVTHDVAEAFKLGTKVLIIDRGRVQQYDTPDRIREQPATEFVRALLSSGAGGGAFCSVAGRDGA